MQQNVSKIAVELSTTRLNLRSYQPSDYEAIHLYASDPLFSQYEGWGPNSPADTLKYLTDMMAQAEEVERWKFEMALALKDCDTFIGSCGIRRESQHSLIANLGWAISPGYQRQGYATEAARCLIEFGFKQLQLQVIYATCDTRNSASWRVMEKLGMKRVGHLLRERQQKGAWRDTYRYEIYRA